MSLHKIVLVRHGESEWTKKNLFCGWYNAPLSEKGVSDAIAVGRKLKESGFEFDVAFTSQLMRAKHSLELILKEIGQPDLPVKCSWKLNERHYGALTGLNKEEAAVKFGYEQVQTWRRSFDVFPPAMDETHTYYQEIENFIVNLNGSDTVYIPKVETLKTTMERVIPFFLENIVPEIVCNKRVLIISHGTSLRGIVKHLEQISDHDIMKINIPTAIPFFYELDLNMKPIQSMVFLSDEETVRKGMLKTASINYKNT